MQSQRAALPSVRIKDMNAKCEEKVVTQKYKTSRTENEDKWAAFEMFFYVLCFLKSVNKGDNCQR